MNLCVNPVFGSVPIIHKYTETAEEITVNKQMGRGWWWWKLLCKQFLRRMPESKM
jgi:hypothetical protein